MRHCLSPKLKKKNTIQNLECAERARRSVLELPSALNVMNVIEVGRSLNNLIFFVVTSGSYRAAGGSLFGNLLPERLDCRMAVP